MASPRFIMRRLRRRGLRPRRGGGFSLVEILIALFVFTIGVLGVFAIFPVALRSGSRSVATTRGEIIAHMAIATLNYELQTPCYMGRPGATHADQDKLQALTGTTWGTDEWVGFYVTLRNEEDSSIARQTRRITSNTATVLTVDSSWTNKPTVGGRWRYAIYRRRLPAAEDTALRRGYVQEINPNAPRVISVISRDREGSTYLTGWTANQYDGIHEYSTGSAQVWQNSPNVTGSGTTWGGGNVPPGAWLKIAGLSGRYLVSQVVDNSHLRLKSPYPGENKTGACTITWIDHYVLFTTGKAAGLCLPIDTIHDDTPSDRLQVRWGELNHAGVEPGDEFVIIGNDKKDAAHHYYLAPSNGLGVPGAAQATSDPGGSEYSYAIIISDSQVGSSQDLVRVDVLVYRNLDRTQSLGGDGSETSDSERRRYVKPVAWQTAYVRRDAWME